MSASAPRAGYRWSEHARFDSGRVPARLAGPYTECSCGFRKNEHGPEQQCPAAIEERTGP